MNSRFLTAISNEKLLQCAGVMNLYHVRIAIAGRLEDPVQQKSCGQHPGKLIFLGRKLVDRNPCASGFERDG